LLREQPQVRRKLRCEAGGRPSHASDLAVPYDSCLKFKAVNQQDVL